MKENLQESLELQKSKLLLGNPELKLVKPCLVNDGIIQFPNENFELEMNSSITWFIPASGSGSRMFQFLYDYLEDQDNESQSVKIFLEKLDHFAFYSWMNPQIKLDFERKVIDNKKLIELLLHEVPFRLGKIPKGMVPFHVKNNKVLNAFQEQVIQGLKLNFNHVEFHFTIQKEFEKEILESIESLDIAKTRRIYFTEQEKSSDSIAFDQNFNPIILPNKNYLTRPSGHGALLSNLNSTETDFIFIKNIDNVQHVDHCGQTILVWKKLLSLTQKIRMELKALWENPSLIDLISLNNYYQLFSKEHISDDLDKKTIREMICRPIRVCGMVKNIGQPGGGPFWIEKNGQLSKQIIEKSQISNNEEQLKILGESSHFNPVMLVASVKDYKGLKFDLETFCDQDSFFVVDKTQECRKIKYIEKPGLWNGSMANWLTVFVEVPSEVFSPVKSILDLLEPAHLQNK
jgi:hypothetical protein